MFIQLSLVICGPVNLDIQSLDDNKTDNPKFKIQLPDFCTSKTSQKNIVSAAYNDVKECHNGHFCIVNATFNIKFKFDRKICQLRIASTAIYLLSS